MTSGSLWDSLNDIIDEPSDTFEILGDSLPEVVGKCDEAQYVTFHLPDSTL